MKSITANGGETIFIEGTIDEVHKVTRSHLEAEVMRFKRKMDNGEKVNGYFRNRAAVHKVAKQPIIDFLLNTWEHVPSGEVSDALIRCFPNADGEDKAILRTVAKEWEDLAPDERVPMLTPEPYDRTLNQWLDNFIPKNETSKETVEMEPDTFYHERKRALESFDKCVDDITHGNGAWRDEVKAMVEQILATAIELDASLGASRGGFRQGYEGFAAIPELVAAGEENCIIDMDNQGNEVDENTAADGAYRIILCTDECSTIGTGVEMTSMMGALILLLKSQRPVELWIQQGWLGGFNGGITLYKMDFTTGFDPTLLSFWCSNPDRDTIYSSYVNDALRGHGHGESMSVCPEIPCDLYIHQWMQGYGITYNNWVRMEPDERIKTMARWITEQYCRIVSDEMVVTA